MGRTGLVLASVAVAFVLSALIIVSSNRSEKQFSEERPQPASTINQASEPEEATEHQPIEITGIFAERVEAISSAKKAVESGIAYLRKQQGKDGVWRSDIYATFKEGTALTPLVLSAMNEGDQTYPFEEGRNVKTRPPRNHDLSGYESLAKLVRPDGTIDEGEDGIDYPVYTSALAVMALSRFEELRVGKYWIGPNGESREIISSKSLLKARDAWLKYLLDRQLTEKLGWNREDKQYGGWGYCRLIPKKPKPNDFAPPLVESNLSATVFALDALKAAGVKDKEVYEKALVFVRRCQNEDGGFHFIYDDPVRNKAGVAEQTPGQPPRFHSYGSTTADGLRSLILCGEPDKDRVAAAKKWLQKNFRADSHPGEYAKAHEPNRDAVYYYYAASVARTLRPLDDFELPDGRDWRVELTKELVKRQRKDGSWANPVELVRENDPIVATANAIIALANCRP